jgi:hypothetical protein
MAHHLYVIPEKSFQFEKAKDLSLCSEELITVIPLINFIRTNPPNKLNQRL